MVSNLLPDPIPGRDCGACTLCCTVPAIDKPELQKVSMATCRHCDKGTGCTIYETRPEICRTYFCAWRRLDIFSDDWRPDLSGVYAELDGEDIPPQFDSSVGINLILVGNPLKAIREPRFIDFVSHGVANNIPLFLSLPGPRGRHCSRLILNTKEYFAAAQRSRADARAELELTLRRLRNAPEPAAHVMKYSGNDVSA
jgi:hypothetical protein